MNTFIEKKLATWIKLSQLQGSELWMQDTLPGLSSFQHERSTELQPKIKTWPTYQCDSNTHSWKLPPHVTLYPFILRMMKKKGGNLSENSVKFFGEIWLYFCIVCWLFQISWLISCRLHMDFSIKIAAWKCYHQTANFTLKLLLPMSLDEIWLKWFRKKSNKF